MGSKGGVENPKHQRDQLITPIKEKEEDFMSIFEKSKVKSENIMIRVTSDQKAAIMDLANSKEMTVTEYLLFLCGQDLDDQAWINRNDLQKSISDLHRLVESAGYSWSVDELCREVFITGLDVLSETYKPSPGD